MKGAIAKADELAATIPGADHPAAVREPGQPGNPPQDHGRGNLERHARQGRHLRRRHRHRRHHHRRRPGASRSASRRCMSSRSSRRPRRFCRAASPARTRSRASAPASRPKILDTSIYDEIVKVSNDDSFANARLVARLEGVPVGISSGAALPGGDRRRLAPGKRRQEPRRRSSPPSPSAICRRCCSRGWAGRRAVS